MKILVTGAGGFVGRNVSRELEYQGHEVITGSQTDEDGESQQRIDMTVSKTVENFISSVQPEVIINCAGVVGAGANFDDNVKITQNLLDAVAVAGLRNSRFVVCGSAGEYGNVNPQDWPVSELTPLCGESPYAQSKVREEIVARDLGRKYNIDVVIARLFNPIGSGMSSKFLIPNLVSQAFDVKDKKLDMITINRLDSLRDYIDIDDAARAIAILATKDHKHTVYNVGSGVATTNREVLDSILEACVLAKDTTIQEKQLIAEGPVASQADITRMSDEFLWSPRKTLSQSIKEITERYYEDK